MAEDAVTLLRNNPPNYFPIPEPLLTTAVVSVGTNYNTVFQRRIASEKKISTFILQKDAGATEIARVEKKLNQFDRILLAIHDRRIRPRSTLDFSTPVLQFITPPSS